MKKVYLVFSDGASAGVVYKILAEGSGNFTVLIAKGVDTSDVIQMVAGKKFDATSVNQVNAFVELREKNVLNELMSVETENVSSSWKSGCVRMPSLSLKGNWDLLRKTRNI